MNRPDLNRICESPPGVTLVASALCARGSSHRTHAPHWLNAGVGLFLFWVGSIEGRKGRAKKCQLLVRIFILHISYNQPGSCQDK